MHRHRCLAGVPLKPVKPWSEVIAAAIVDTRGYPSLSPAAWPQERPAKLRHP